MTGSEKNTRQLKKQKQGKPFVLPEYDKDIKVIRGDLIIAVPDGFEKYEDNGALLIKNEDDLLIIKASGLDPHDIDTIWRGKTDVDKAEFFAKTGKCKNVRFIIENDDITVAYGKKAEAGKEEEPYWISYSLIVLSEKLSWLFELRFNYRRSTAKNYNRAVEDFGSRLAAVKVSPADELKACLAEKERELAETDAEWKESEIKREELALKLEEAEKASIKLLTEKMIEEESYKLQINNKRTELKNLEEQVVQLDTERKEIKSKKEKYKSDIKEIRSDCRKKSEELSKERVKLVKSLFELNSEISGIREEKDEKKNKLKSAFLFKKKKRQEYDEAKKRLNEKDSEISACDQDIKELDDKIEEIKDNTENEINRIKDEISLMSEKERGLQLALNNARDDIKKHKEGLTSLEEQIKNYDLRHADDGKELAEFKQQYDFFDELVNKKATRREELQKEIAALKQKLADIS